jgi:predicted acyltransferase
VVYTTGWALVVLATLYWTIDVRAWRLWARPFVVYGMNAITVFVASGMLAKTLIRWPVEPSGTGGATTGYGRIYEVGFAPFFEDPCNASLAFAITVVLFWLAVMWVLYRKRIFLKV